MSDSVRNPTPAKYSTYAEYINDIPELPTASLLGASAGITSIFTSPWNFVKCTQFIFKNKNFSKYNQETKTIIITRFVQSILGMTIGFSTIITIATGLFAGLTLAAAFTIPLFILILGIILMLSEVGLNSYILHKQAKLGDLPLFKHHTLLEKSPNELSLSDIRTLTDAATSLKDTHPNEVAAINKAAKTNNRTKFLLKVQYLFLKQVREKFFNQKASHVCAWRMRLISSTQKAALGDALLQLETYNETKLTNDEKIKQYKNIIQSLATQQKQMITTQVLSFICVIISLIALILPLPIFNVPADLLTATTVTSISMGLGTGITGGVFVSQGPSEELRENLKAHLQHRQHRSKVKQKTE